MDTTPRPDQKPATAARIYDYYIGGTHNFPADRAAAEAAIAQVPQIREAALANRAFLGRAVRCATESGIRQFLDIGSGIPTEGNVHEIAQEIDPEARVVYVDIDPVAVAEGLGILDRNPYATSIRGDLLDVKSILSHPSVAELIDFSRPVGVILCAVLHFVPDDTVAHEALDTLRKSCAPGSFLILSHATLPDDIPVQFIENEKVVGEVYQSKTVSPFRMRRRDGVLRLFEGYELAEPGLVWVPQWRPAPDDPKDFVNDYTQSGILAGVGVLRAARIRR
jgi:hypothetical protein